MRPIDLIVIHCTASPNGVWYSAADIDAWHRQRGFVRLPEFVKRQNPSLLAIGYHFVIYTNGAVASGRHLEEVGAHAKGHNRTSLGISLVGTDKFTPIQWEMLRANVRGLRLKFPDAQVVGHRELNPGKTCPGFDVQTWLENDMNPDPAHILEVL